MNKQEKIWLKSKIPTIECIAFNIEHPNTINLNFDSEALYLINFVKEIKEKTNSN